MSWLDRIDSGVTITTGDGKSYQPLWKNAQKSVEFNISEFNFPDVQGTLVYRGTAMGRKFPLELYFQGDDHLDVSDAFELSARDPRPWVISHPFYNDIIVHPISLSFDNKAYNVTQITGQVMETISDVYPKSSIQPGDQIEQLQNVALESAAQDFVSSIPKPNTADINKIQENTTDSYNRSLLVVKTTEASEELRLSYAESTSAVLNAATEPLLAITAAQTALSYPGKFEQSVSSRLGVLLESFQTLGS